MMSKIVKLTTIAGLATCLLLSLALPLQVQAVTDSENFYAEELLKAARSYDNMYTLNGDRDKAVELYRRYLRESPNVPRNIDIEFRLGQLLDCAFDRSKGERARLDEAIEVYKGIVERYPSTQLKRTRAQMFLGNCYWWKGFYNKAENQYRQVMEIKEDNIKLPAGFESSEQKVREKKLEQERNMLRLFKTEAKSQIVDMAMRSGTNVELVANLHQVLDRYGDPEIGELVRKQIGVIEKRDPRNIAEIAILERQVIKQLVSNAGGGTSLDDQYLTEINRLEREFIPKSSYKQIKKEIYINTEESLAAMEQKVMEESEEAVKKAIKE